MYKCPCCGGELEYIPGAEQITCEYCGTRFDPDELAEEKEVNAAEYDDSTMDATVFTCPQCGGEILNTDGQAVTFCSYCGSQVALTSRLKKIKKPDVIIPFKISKDECKKAYIKKLRGALFAPGFMKKDTEISKFRGIYMPYWTYSMSPVEEIDVSSKTSSVSGNYQVETHYRTSIFSEGTIEGASYDGASAFSDELSEAIAPFDANEMIPFNASYLSSYYADESDVDAKVYREFAENTTADIYADKVYRDDMAQYGINRNTIAESFVAIREETRLAYFPVWFLGIKSKKGNRVSYAAVNGQTGKLVSDLPVDFKKYLLASLIISVPVFLLLTLLISMTTKALMAVVIVLCAVVAFILNRSLNRVYTRQGKYDDLGLASLDPSQNKKIINEIKRQKRKIPGKGSSSGHSIGYVIGHTFYALPFILVFSVGLFSDRFGMDAAIGIAIIIFCAVLVFRIIYTLVKRKNKTSNTREVTVSAPMKEKMKTLWKCLVGIVVPGLMLIINPVDDFFYYGAAIVAIVFIGLSVLDIVRLHNSLTLRALPQFGKRGGDDSEI